MNFYNKSVGRPTIEELGMIHAIEQIILSKKIPSEIIPQCDSLDDLVALHQFVENYQKNEVVQSIDETTTQITEETQESEEINKVETEEERKEINVNPIEETNEVFRTDEDIIKEVLSDESPDFVANDYDPFSQPIIERSYTNGTQTKDSTQTEESEDDIILEEAKEKTPLDDVPPVTKKRAAEQTADALLKGYARLIPEPFKWLSKISEEKVERMAFDGELDLSIEVSEGLTFEDYMHQTNAQIDEIFEVDEETLDEIREPLIEVLMEQELELTPTQRLTMAVVSHLVQMLTVALKLKKQNNRILSYQQHLSHLYSTKSNVA